MKKLLATLLLFISIFPSNALAGQGYSSSSGRSYSSSSSSFGRSSGGFSSSSSSSRSYTSPSRSYSSGSSYTSPSRSISPKSSYSSPSSNSKPSGSFQSLLSGEQRKAEARVQYQRATAPKETYTSPSGSKIKIQSSDPRVEQVRKLSEDKWVNRETRVHTFYHNYYAHPPTTVVHYNDPYSTWFWLWLMERNVNDRAYWAYNHAPGTPYAMDEARYRDLLAKDKELAARVKQLEAEKKTRDPNYVPPGLEDSDLQYTDEYVNAVYNPQPKEHPPVSWGVFFHELWVLVKWVLYVTLIGVSIWVIVWFVFYKKW